MQILAAAITASDIAELVRLYRTESIRAADDHARVLIITKNLDGPATAAMFTAFMREAYSLRQRAAETDRQVAELMGHDQRAVARGLRESV